MNEIFKHILHEFQLPLSNPVLIFSLILAIILLAPILLKKINIPGIIGLIISGVIIGPYGAGVLENDSAIHLFSTIGILYIMFIAGLELDLNQFKANRNKSLAFGAFTFAFPLIIGFPVCYFFLGYDVNASILTASMFATHTLVAYPIVSKFGVSKNEAVAITVGGTILTDTAVLMILAVIMGNNEGSLNGQFWVRMGISIILFSLLMFFVVPRIAKWFFRKMESEKHAHYIFVLAVVFFAAFLAEVIGLEPIIGAFVAGLALNRLVPHSSALMNRIEFIGNSLFIPFFLISVGMLVDVRVILNGPSALIIAGTLSAVAVFGKWIAAWVTRVIFKYSKDQGHLIFGLSSSHAAATLAVILVGYKAGILDENILNGTIILILITCVIASFVTEKAAKRIAISDEEAGGELGTLSEFHDEHIMMPIGDLGKVEKLLEFALLIKDNKSPNPVSLLSVVPGDDDAEQNILRSRNKLEAFVKQASAAGMTANVLTTIDHNQASGIARASREIMADVIVLEWPKPSRIFDKIVGEDLDSVIENVDKNLFIGHFTNNLVTHKRIVLISPPLAELEKGFELWVRKVARLAQELSISVLHYGHAKTAAAIDRLLKRKGFNVTITHSQFNEWDDFLILARNIHDEDLVVMISARKGAVSHMGVLDTLPSKLGKYLKHNNKIIVYPQQFNQNQFADVYEDISASPLTKGIEAIEQLSKGIGNIFRKK